MGLCLSCLRVRDKAPSAEGTEREPLLSVHTDSDLDGLAEDQQLQQRQQEVSHIVQTTHDYFVDIPSLDVAEVAEPGKDVTALAQRVRARASEVELRVPDIKDLSPADRERLKRDLA